MKKVILNFLFIIIFLVTKINFVKANEINHYNFIPTKVSEGFQISHLAKLDSLNIIAGGKINISPLPDYIENTGIFKSTDGGSNWRNIFKDTNQLKPIESRFDSGIKHLEYLSENRILIFYENGFIRRSEDGGKTWALDSMGKTWSVYEIEFIDKDNGFTIWNIQIGAMQTITKYMRTTNGGKDWIVLNIPLDSIFNEKSISYLHNFNILSKDTVLITSTNFNFENDSVYDSEIYVLSTTNLGKEWDKRLLLKEENINSRDPISRDYTITSFQFISYEVGYWMGATPSYTKVDIVGNPWEYPFLKKTIDGGKTWETIFHDTDSSKRSRTALEIIDYQDEDILIFKGNPSGILLYKQGETFFRNVTPQNYSELNKNYGYNSISDFIRLNDNNIMIAGNSEYVYTIDFKNPLTSVNKNVDLSSIIIYPSPVPRNETIYIGSFLKTSNVEAISILDINGRTITVNKNIRNLSLRTIQINSEIRLSQGIYFVQIKYKNGMTQRQKFIVE